MNYVFFQDESGHDSKFTNKELGFNFEMPDSSAYFVNVIIGFQDTMLKQFEDKFCEIENRNKRILGIKSENEFKATSIANKHFEFGLSRMPAKYIDFYRELFNLIDQDCIVHVSTINKLEQVLLSTLRLDIEKINFLNVFLLIQFLDRNKTKELRELIMDSNSTISDLFNEIDSIINNYLLTISNESEEYEYVQYFARYFREIIKKIDGREKIELDYEYIFDGFKNLLNMKNIEESGVELIVDGLGNSLDKVFQGAKTVFPYSKIVGIDSSKSPSTRVVDFFANLIFRFLRNMEKEVKINWNGFLNEEWFEISNENNFLALQELGNIFNNRKSVFWTTHNGIYSEVAIYFYQYISYFSIFNDFQEYNTFSPFEHSYYVQNNAQNKIAKFLDR